MANGEFDSGVKVSRTLRIASTGRRTDDGTRRETIERVRLQTRSAEPGAGAGRAAGGDDDDGRP
jgi:hypothetical protein